MEPESLHNMLQLPKAVGRPAEEELPQGEKKKYLPPTSRRDPKFGELQKVLMEWINAKLLPEHIVVRSLEEDIFDGLILHHLFQMLTGLRLDVEEMALTVPNQRRKLEAVLEAVNRSLRAEDQSLKWSVDAIFNKDLLATLHLLVALAKRFQPDLPLPTNVQVEVITMEDCRGAWAGAVGGDIESPCLYASSSPKPIFSKRHDFIEEERDKTGGSITARRPRAGDQPVGFPAPLRAEGVSQVHSILRENRGPPQNADADRARPGSCPTRGLGLHNVTLALELLKDEGLLSYPINPEDIVNKDTKSTLRVLYSLFRKHKLKENADSTPRGSPN
ncbi:gamma-parvin [Puma concolor]|uniref:Gamma-parvin n=1 Tax=Puma concolor TaxID=9696 RepID=A0A6P6I2P5_PUMCO|nr:gamma-parvin [Puma concolor]